MIRILLVDDQNIVWQGLQALFKNRPQIEMVGYATNGKQALEMVAQHRPDIVLIDIEMPEMNGIVATQKISQQFPQTGVIIFSSHEDIKYTIQSLKAGAKGYLLKHTLFEDLEKAIELVHHGYSQIESRLLTKVIEVASKTQDTKAQNNLPISARESKLVNHNSLPLSSLISVGSTSKSLNNRIVTSSKSRESEHRPPNSQTIAFEVKPDSVPDADFSRVSKSASDNSAQGQKVHNHGSSNETLDELIDPTEPKEINTHNSSRNKVFLGSIIILAIAASILASFQLRLFKRKRLEPQPSAAPVISVAKAERKTVVALGRIEPLGKVIALSAPTSLEAVKIEQLLVQEDELVEVGQIIAVLDGRQRLQAALDEAVTGVEIAQARLGQVKAGAKPSSVQAKQAAIANLKAELAGKLQTQRSTIAKLEAQLNNARSELQRHQLLYQQGAISTSELDRQRLTTNTAQEQLNEARAILRQTRRTLSARIQEAIALLAETEEVRDVDLQLAQAELNQAQAAANKAKSDMELAYVRTSIAGQILAIHTRPGEAPGQKGIVEIGKTEQMVVVAEVDQNDIKLVEIGQPATVVSGIFDEKLQGKVHKISSQVGKNDILNTDPAADEDTRVVEVQILLEPESSQKVSTLTNLEVDVTIKV
ncbi:MAG: response regulator [Cyanobacteria bacterium P01_A01_bin.83]